MIRKILGRLAAVRPLVFAFFALASFAASAFDTPYLTFRSASSFNITVYSAKWDGTMEYSTDAVAWTTWTGSSISGVLSDGQYRLYLRGMGNSTVSGGSSWSLSGTSDLYCEGDIETLRDYNGNSPAMATSCYKYIFLGWSKLKSAPALSATALTNECYASMFNGCTSLETAPALSATTIAEKCYQSMFSGCTSLTAAPALPATTMKSYCYGSMFNGCTSITESPALPATTLADHCYSSMFMGCTGLKSIPVLPATTTMSASYYQMFKNCSSLVVNSTGDPSVAWSLPTMVSAGSIYNSNMFQGTSGDFTGNPVAGTTYYVASAIPPGLRQETAELHAYTGASISIDLADTIAGGTGEYTFTDSASTLSSLGLSLSGNTLSGTISTANSYVFTLHVEDTTSPNPLALDPEYTLVVADPDPIAAATNLTATVGKANSFNIAETISGGVPPYSLAFSGTEPTGFSYNAGVLSGTATEANAYNFTITATDSLGTVQVLNYTLVTVESSGFTDDDPEEPASGDSVDCRTADGVVRSRTCNQIADSSTVVTWTDSWYYVAPNATVTLSAGAIVSGKVSLVLGDGATLTVQSTTSGKAGIRVAIEGSVTNSLTIYCQGAGTGKLVAKGGSAGAGIGGDNKTSGGTGLGDCGKVTIFGGVIEATGSGDAAGIGGGDWRGKGGTVVVYGGTVTASAGSSNAAGIGGGWNATDGVLTVGETILVKAGSSANPTTELQHGEGGAITLVHSGRQYYVITTTGPEPLSQTTSALSAYANETKNWNLADTIAGGTAPYTFTLKSGSALPTGLALNGTSLGGAVAGAGVYSFTYEVTDSSATPLALDATYTLTVTAPDPLSAQTDLGVVKVGKSKSVTLSDTVSGGVPPYAFAASGTLPSGFALSGDTLSFTASAAGNFSASIVATDSIGTVLNVTYTIEAIVAAGFTEDDPDEPDVGTEIDCLTPDGVFPRTCNQIVDSSIVVTWEDSWYYVTGDVTLSAGAIVSGKVSLILCDGATLTVQVSSGNAGIKVTEGNALTIYAQSNGAAAGVMTVTSGMYGAGIGGIESVNSGTVNIYGGNITATGNSRSAGIGGGRYAHNGKVVIAGGIVNATGGFGGAGIGGGDTGNGGIVNIDGGDVHAVGGWYAAGIGGGYNGTGGSVTVRGGSVSAIGYDSNTPGIGAYASNQGELTVGANIVVKAGSSATLTDADIKNPNGETSIPLTTKYRYYSFETTGPVPLAQKPGAGALAALVGGEASWTLSDTIAGGEAPYSFEPKSGYEPPAFLTLANGVLSGIPTAAGSWTFTLVVTDSNSDSIEAEYTLTVSAPAALSANGALGNIVKNAAANYNLSTTVSGGIPGYTFALKAGSTLPGGLILENGVISGSPTTAGNYAFTIVVSDSALPTANTIEAEYTLSVKEIYNIVYKDKEGTGNLALSPSTYVEGTGVATLPTPTAAGWVFTSWHYDSNLMDDPVTSIPANATGDKILYSKWEENLSGIVPMTFIDVDGSSQTTNCTVIDSTTTTLASGWYTVANDITFPSKTLTVAGDVKIVLRDGKTMTITSGENNKAGVSVADGYSLSIYGQSAGTGTLNTKGNWYGAGIGGNNGVKGGTVTINGGTVIATSGKDAAGIGGGLDADGGTVVINGGNVTVTSNNDGAGIGGGKNGAGGTLTVNGGSVSVQGYQYGTTSPGVGGGVGATQHGRLYVGDYVSVMAGNRSNQMTERTPDANGEIALAGEIFFSFASTKPVSVSYLDTDGVVKYTNCVILASSTAQLSNGWYAATSSVNIPLGLTVLDDVKLIIADGATVTVPAGTTYGKAGISVGTGNSLTIYSQEVGTGVLNATGCDSGAGIGGNNGVACGSVTINGCTINATGGSSGAGIGGGYTAAGGTVIVNGGTVNATGGDSNTPGIGGGFGSNIAQGTLRVADGLIVKAGATADPAGTPERDPVTNEITLGKERYYVIVAPDASTEFPIAYMDGDTPLNLSPSAFTYGSGLAVLPVPAAAYGFAFDGWYDNDALTGSAVTSIPAGLMTGVTLYAKWKPATVATTFIGADGSQTEDCTVLIAERNALSDGWYVVEGTLDYGTAGITVSGDVNLVLKDGAQLTVAGAMYNAGISVPYGSSLAIYAQSEGEGMGTLSATGGSRGAGIGGGDGVAAGTIAIYGGTVTAQSDGYAAGIGGGYMSDGGDVTINGGVVNATGGTNGAGIGSGPGTTRDNIICSGGTVTINGGSVTAIGGANGAGIGGGQVGNGATVVVNGGTVSATGGDDSQMPIPSCGIGCGFGSNLSYGTLAVDAAMAVRAGLSANPATVLVRNAETGAVMLGGQHCFAIATAQTFGIVYMDGENEIVGLLPDEYVEGTGVDLPGKNDVVKDGWSFQGWYSDSALEIGPVFAVPPTVGGTRTFYAKFIEGGETELVQTQSELDGVATGTTVNQDISWTIDGGIAPYTFAVKAGTRLPPGLKLSGSTISGVLADAGTYNFTITVTDSTGPVAQTIDAAYTLVATGEHAGPLFSINDAGTLIASHPRGNVSVAIPDTVRGISVKALGAGLFKDCDYLESVTIPSGVTNIMNGAFENCTAMPSITLPAGLERIDSRAFYGCTALVGVTIPSGVREIGVLAFNECTALASISIPGSVTTIGADAFDGCTALASVTFADGVETIGPRAFMDCAGLSSVAFPDSVTTIGESAFSRCYGITSVTLGDGVETIGDTAFNSCTNLAVLTFGTSLATIGEGAFFGCESLVGDGVNVFYIPDGVTSIGDVAFRGTSIEKASLPGDLYEEGAPADGAFNLTARVMYRTEQVVYHTRSNGLLWAVDLNGNTVANIPSSVKEIGPAAFEGCDSVVTVTVPSSVNNISTRAFYGCSSLASVNVPYGVLSIGGQAFASCTNLTSISIPDATTQIGNGVFWGCSSLESVTLGTGVTEIPDFAFKDCESLATVTIGGNIERIGTLAFENCSALTGISLPSSLTTIGSWAFESCTSLAQVTIPKGVTIGLSAFAHCTGLVSVNISGEVKRRTKKMSLRLSAAAPTTLLGTSNPDATTVGGYAFYGCDALEDVIIGATVEDIGGGAFSGCRSIRSMDVEAGNDNFMSVDGLILTKDGATLISAFGNETEITVANSVVIIEAGAFSGYSTLTNAVLPSGVTTIGEAAFSNATQFASITIPESVTTIGANAFCDTVLATVYVAKGDTERVQALVVGTGYAGTVAYVELQDEEPKPSIAGDGAATVTGDAESGYVVTPSTTTGTVEVEIPSGLDPAKVTVEVPATASVKPNGAAIKVVNGANDITAFLDIPAADANGVVNLNDATVKDAIVEEVLDPEEGAVLVLTPENPSITTAKTRAGLTYTFYEGTTLQNMAQKAAKVGDGNAWTPAITVKGGSSGFYSVHVTK